MNEDGFGKLGFYNLALISITCGIGCLTSTTLLMKLGWKACLIIGAVCNALWVFASVVVAMKKYDPNSESYFYSKEFVYPLLIIASILSGFCNAILWIA